MFDLYNSKNSKKEEEFIYDVYLLNLTALIHVSQ